MYTSFYNLNRKPFQISSDPAFMWFGEKHKEALATLRYGIMDNKGFLLLTGDVGTGKTTLINALLQSLAEDVVCATVPDPGLEKLDFFNYIAAAFGIEKEFTSKGTFLSHFRRFLLESNENNKKVLLIIDESQLLTQEMLEEIRLLSNIEKTDAKLINIFFVGQNEFNEILNREQNRAVRQRLTLNYNIDPLTPDETAEYIKHRLSIAGAARPIFDQAATQEVFIYSGGFPRRINVICDHSLLSGYVNEKKTIDGATVRECAKELKIPAMVKNRDINGFASLQEKPQPVAAPQRVYQPIPEQRHPKKKRGFAWMLLLAVLCLILAAAGYFYLFPDRYSNAQKIASNLTSTLLARVSQSSLSFLKVLSRSMQNPEGEVNKNSDPPAEESAAIFRDTEKNLNKKETNTVYPIQEKFPVSGPVSATTTIETEDFSNGASMKISPGGEENRTAAKNTNDLDTPPPFSVATLEKSLKDKDLVKIEKQIPALPAEKVTVRFKYNTNDFTDEGYAKLIRFTDILVMHPDAEILITGYSDSEGYEKYNQKLSEFRANIVGSFLLGKGIKPDKIEIQGLGSQNPIESNATAAGRKMNRRVEIEVKKKPPAPETDRG